MVLISKARPLAIARQLLFRQPELGRARGEPFFGFGGEVVAKRDALRRREGRQAILAQLDLEVAAPRDLDRVLQGLRHFGEQLRHLACVLKYCSGVNSFGRRWSPST
jgi:hypothetical protein